MLFIPLNGGNDFYGTLFGKTSSWKPEMAAVVAFPKAICVSYLVFWVAVVADNSSTLADVVSSTVRDNNGTAPTVSVTNATAAVIVCRIDATIDFRADANNVYECRSGEKCCLEDGIRPACCVDMKMDEEVMDQLKLWGGVLGAATAVGVLICCCRRDIDCCEGDENCVDYVKCRCCRRHSESEEHRGLTPPSPSRRIGVAFDPSSIKMMAKDTHAVSLSVQDLHAQHLSQMLDAEKTRSAPFEYNHDV